jgi:para-aminobenzoate synthetase
LNINRRISSTSSLAALCHQAIPDCRIYIIKNNQLTIRELAPYLKFFSAIVIGPGPGSADIPDDIGIVKDLWRVADESLIPIFGVCLGLQSLSIEFGANQKRLNVVKHGQISYVHHKGIDIFAGVGTVHAVRYHSLHVQPLENGEIEELAWADDGPENGRVVMAVKHRSRPFWAVQYHPESACTKGGGLEVFCNFWNLALRWGKTVGKIVSSWNSANDLIFCSSWPPKVDIKAQTPLLPTDNPPQVITSVLELPELNVPAVCECLRISDDSFPFMVLESTTNPGQFSIVAAIMPTSPRIMYYAGDSFVTLIRGNSVDRKDLRSQDIWAWLSSFMQPRRAIGGRPEVRFWGGLVGYFSYELGTQALHVPLKKSPGDLRHADVNLVFVERSIVLNSTTGRVYVQSILSEDVEWVSQTCLQLKHASLLNPAKATSNDSFALEQKRTVPSSSSPAVTLPDKKLYISRIGLAKERLFAGDSYELCLTAQTRVTVPKTSCGTNECSSWELYKRLRINNPAPYAAYLRLGPTTLISSSPERFLSFSRPPDTIYQMRPIKGTVRKSPSLTRAMAEKALAGSKKEVAENLMIVDLIRHDLHSVVGTDVRVKQFCNVEEYETVWQLVSAIEGRFCSDVAGREQFDATGCNVLKMTLPPGLSCTSLLVHSPNWKNKREHDRGA